MDTLARFIVNKRKFIVTVFIILALLSAVMMLGLSINYNLTDYLPSDAQSTVALNIMGEEFDSSVPNVRVMVRDVDLMDAVEWKARIANIEGVDSVMWLDDIVDIREPIEVAGTATVESYYKDNAALYSVTVDSEHEVDAVNALYSLLGDKGSIDGNAVTNAAAQDMASSEVVGAVIIIVPLITLILLLTSSSWVEPLLFFGAIGVAVLLNMGTNIFLGEISNITMSISPILQLAVSLDYAIFLLHRFQELRATEESAETAMRKAIKRSFPAIASSASTTLFGFLALLFMDFGLGPDLGLNLAKGIIFSYISVMIFMPALTLCFYPLIDKTRHRRLIPDFHRIGRRLLKIRVPALVIILILVIPCYLGQARTGFIYGMGDPEPTSTLGQDTAAINEVFGESTAMVILVPRGDVASEGLLAEELNSMDHVTSVVSYASSVGTSIPEEYLDEAITSNFYAENYARIILYTDTNAEGDQAFALVEDVRQVTANYYDEYYTCGESANLYDMKQVITKDNTVVNLVAVIAIALVLLITFRSLSLPLLLVFIIESAIWINLSISYFTGTSLSYVGYLVINTVQLGATIDYAILLTESYTTNRTRYRKRIAMEYTLKQNFIPILTSALILSIAGIALSVTSTNTIVSELGSLLAKGTILSFASVICALPCVLLMFDKLIKKTTMHTSSFKEEI